MIKNLILSPCRLMNSDSILMIDKWEKITHQKNEPLLDRNNLPTPMDISYLPRAYLPSNRGLTGSLSAGSWSFSQHRFLAASHLGPLLQLLFPWVAEIPVVLKQESKNQNEIFFTKELFSKKISILVFWLLHQNYWDLSNPWEQKLKKRTQVTCCQKLVLRKWPGACWEAASLTSFRR